MKGVLKPCLIAALAFLAPLTGFAHHGTGVSYDPTKFVTLTGTVTKFTYKNPHAFIEIDVKGEKGEIVHWVGEMNSPTVLREAGWTINTVKTGDEVTLTVNPSRIGVPNGVVTRMRPIIINGKTLSSGPEN